MADINIQGIVNSLKGIQGTGQLLGIAADLMAKLGATATLEPGDIVMPGDHKTPMRISAPLAYDLWYLYNDVNLVHHIDPNTDSGEYVNENLKFLQDKMMGIRPLKALTNDDLHATYTSEQVWKYKPVWTNEGAYFIQVMAYEMAQKNISFSYDSVCPGIKEEYVGAMMFPVGQLGVMEVISMFQESIIEASSFTMTGAEIPVITNGEDLFTPMKRAGEGWCYGQFLIESGYIIPDQMKYTVEIMAPVNITEAEYTRDIKPKTWTKIWIKKEDTFPVPGEFIGILIKPLSVPPHIWWFQESTPLLYSGNWVETQNLTSGIITEVTLEEDRDGESGDEYKIRINGTEITAYPSDFKRYEVGDRVAVLKRWTTASKAERSFTWKDQRDAQHPVKGQTSEEFMIMPITFYE